MAKVSIIVPVYNVEKYLECCLESLINQTLKDIEIICVNDGSTDNSGKILDNYAAKDNRIKIISQENKKQGAARNRGLEIACGEYIGFIDSDDYIDNDYYEKMYETSQKYSCDIVVASILKHKKNYDKFNILYKNITEAETLSQKIDICKDKKNRFFNVTNKIYRSSFIKGNNLLFAEGCYFEDVMFSMKTIFYANKIFSCPNVKYHYVSHESSTVKSSNNQNKKKQDHIIAYTELQKFAKENNIKLPEYANYFVKYWKGPVKVRQGTYKTKILLLGFIPVFMK